MNESISQIMGGAIASLYEAMIATGTKFTDADKSIITSTLLSVLSECCDDETEKLVHAQIIELLVNKYL